MEVAGYPLDSDDNKIMMRTSKGLEDITQEEEKELLDYLRFLRHRRGGK